MRRNSPSCEMFLRTKLREDFASDPDFDFGNPFVLQVDENLPDVCLRHGKSVNGKTEADFRFVRSEDEWIQDTAGNDMIFFGRYLRNRMFGLWPKDAYSAGSIYRRASKSVVLEGEWPLCTRCRRASKVVTFLGDFLASFGVVPASAVFLVLGNTVPEVLLHPMAALMFPIWCPFGIVLSFTIYRGSATYIRFDPIDDVTRVRARAHPNFVAAFESRGTVL